MQDGVIPQPVFMETTRHHYCYTRGELQVVANVLREHEREFVYLSLRNEAVVHQINQSVMAYRRQHYGEPNEAT